MTGIKPREASVKLECSLASLVSCCSTYILSLCWNWEWFRIYSVHRRMVHDSYHKAFVRGPAGWPLSLPLRKHRDSACFIQPQDWKTCRRTTPHAHLQTGRHVKEFLFQVSKLAPSDAEWLLTHCFSQLYVRPNIDSAIQFDKEYSSVTWEVAFQRPVRVELPLAEWTICRSGRFSCSSSMVATAGTWARRSG